MDWSKFTLALLIAIGFSSIITLPFILKNSKWKTDKVEYVESTHNQEISNQANILFETELNELIKEADFKIYDQIENDDRSYVAGILYFNNRNDYDNFEESEKKISELFTSEYSLDSHVCYLKFVYKESGSISTKQRLYDSGKEEK